MFFLSINDTKIVIKEDNETTKLAAQEKQINQKIAFLFLFDEEEQKLVSIKNESLYRYKNIKNKKKIFNF